MKIIVRITLLLFFCSAMLTSFHASGQSFVLKNENNIPINYGDTIVVTGPDTMFLEAGIFIENISTVGKLVQVQRIDLNVVPGVSSYMMWGVMEYPPSATLTVEGDSVGAFMTNYTFMSGYVAFGLPGTSWYKYIFFDENNPSDSAWAVIQYNASGTSGIKKNTLNEVSIYPNPGNGIYNLSFPSIHKPACRADVFNSTGDLLFVSNIEEYNNLFCLDLRKYIPGIYFLKVTETNGAFRTWKIIKM